MSTKDNLQNAFAGESQANRRYIAFSSKAKIEGYPNIAKLFFAAAEAETVHALAHLNVMRGPKSTKENLKAALEGEAFEFEKMYPDYVKQAEKEGEEGAVRTFKYAMAVEKIHHRLYQQALDALEKGEDLPDADYYVCPICGNTFAGDVPDNCPICRTPKKQIRKIG
jgi:rubrerythrin